MQDWIIYICIFGIVALVGWFITMWRSNTDDGKLRDRLKHANPTLTNPNAKKTSSGEGIGEMFKQIGQAAAKPFEPKTREEQSIRRKKLAKAGIYSPAALRLLDGSRVLLLAFGLIAGYVLGSLAGQPFLGLPFGGLFGYMAPTIWLNGRIKKQHRALDRGLADAIDLMVVCVEAGLTVDGAMQRVGQELVMAHPALAREMEIVHMETRVGLARSEALRNLGQRTGSQSLQALSAMLIQAERFGTSIASALRIHADSLRTSRQHQAEEQAAKATVKLSFPVVLFIFPAVLIVLAGPAAIGLFKSALFAE